MSPHNPHSCNGVIENTSSIICDNLNNCENIVRYRKCESAMKNKETKQSEPIQAQPVLPETDLKHKLRNRTNSETVKETFMSNDNKLKSDICETCNNIKQPPTKLRLYQKRPEDNILSNSSIRTALFNLSPTWIKSFIQEPEYVMNDAKTKFKTE